MRAPSSLACSTFMRPGSALSMVTCARAQSSSNHALPGFIPS